MTGRPLRALPSVAAYAAGVQVKTLHQWVRRGHLSPPVDGLFDLVEVLAWLDTRDTHHAKIAHNRYHAV